MPAILRASGFMKKLWAHIVASNLIHAGVIVGVNFCGLHMSKRRSATLSHALEDGRTQH
jgi:hypothetical protein